MRYLCLVYCDEKKLEALSDGDRQALADAARAYDEEMRRSGYRVASNALQPVHAATTLRVCNGEVFVTSGPCVETREQLEGYVLVEARDLNEAIRVASQIPSARLGCIEVWPVSGDDVEFRGDRSTRE